MIVIRDDDKIARMRRLSQWLTFLGLGALIAGIVILFTMGENTNVFIYQFIALVVGWALSQIGVYLGHRYVRKPRPDEVLDDAVRKVAKNGRMYHYVLPVPHVLLTKKGVVVFVPKFQTGEISADGDDWNQSGIGLRKWFGQEGLGNPSKEADAYVGKIANFLRKNAPEVEEAPIAPMIVFTSKDIKELNVENANYPALYHTKVEGYLRHQWQKHSEKLDSATYKALKRAFDESAGNVEAERV